MSHLRQHPCFDARPILQATTPTQGGEVCPRWLLNVKEFDDEQEIYPAKSG